LASIAAAAAAGAGAESTKAAYTARNSEDGALGVVFTTFGDRHWA
jgi:hypothetical protein